MVIYIAETPVCVYILKQKEMIEGNIAVDIRDGGTIAEGTRE